MKSGSIIHTRPRNSQTAETMGGWSGLMNLLVNIRVNIRDQQIQGTHKTNPARWRGLRDLRFDECGQACSRLLKRPSPASPRPSRARISGSGTEGGGASVDTPVRFKVYGPSWYGMGSRNQPLFRVGGTETTSSGFVINRLNARKYSPAAPPAACSSRPSRGRTSRCPRAGRRTPP